MFSLSAAPRNCNCSVPAPAPRTGNTWVRSLCIKFLKAGCASLLTVGTVSDASAAELPLGYYVGWGYDGFGQSPIPAISSPVVLISAISSNGRNTVTLRNDGSVRVWRALPPKDLGNITAVAAATAFMMALQRDGTVVFWGEGPDAGRFGAASPTGVKAIAARGPHGMGIRSDGTVSDWSMVDGKLVDNPVTVGDVIAVAAGYEHGLGLTTEGKVVGWGKNDAGQIAIPGDLTNVVAIAASAYNSFALKDDGSVVAWGADLHNLKNGVPDPEVTRIKAIAAGDFHVLAITTDDRIIGWGDNSFGQLDVPSGLTNVKAVAAGSYNSFALNPAPLLNPAAPRDFYVFSGFHPPVASSPVVNLGKAGRSYAVKWQLKDRNDAIVSAPAAVKSVNYERTQCGNFSTSPADAPEAASASDAMPRYDSTTRQYIYNWKTPAAGCYTLFLTLASGQVFSAYFNLGR